MTNKPQNLPVARCGMFCGGCGAYCAKDNPSLLESLVALGMNRDNLPCPGCRSAEGRCPIVTGVCLTFRCAENHNVEFCFECDEFPCSKLSPAADKASILLHNTKVFNLCCIKKNGIEKWLESAEEIQNKYLHGKMVLGKGPQME